MAQLTVRGCASGTFCSAASAASGALALELADLTASAGDAGPDSDATGAVVCDATGGSNGAAGCAAGGSGTFAAYRAGPGFSTYAEPKLQNSRGAQTPKLTWSQTPIPTQSQTPRTTR